MSSNKGVENFAKNLVGGFNSIDGDVIGEKMQPIKMQLFKDEKGAIVGDVVDKYLRKELTNEYLQEVKISYGVTAMEITREIAKRQILQVMGQL